MRPVGSRNTSQGRLPIAYQLLRWLWTLLLCNGAITALAVLCFLGRGESLHDAAASLGSLHLATLLNLMQDDSWTPMLRAYQLKLHDASADMYRLVLEEHVKFQYPPSSLLTLAFIPRSLLVPDAAGAAARPLLVLLSWAGRLCLLANVVCAAFTLELSGRRAGLWAAPAASRGVGSALWMMRLRFVLACALGLGFYPLFKAYSLGQLQVFVNLMVCLSVLCFVLQREAAAGVLLALCCWMKPQYGVLLLFGALRRRWRFTGAFVGVLALGTLISLARFGLHDHLRYVEVLRMLARLGEIYWPNQSVHGLLQRFVDPSHAVVWTSGDFGRDVPWIHTVSTLNTLLILVLCSWPFGSGSAARGGSVDLCVALAGVTLMSPVAWEHHYGYFLSLFAVALPWLARARPLGAASVPLLGACFVVVTNSLLRPEIIYKSALRGLLGSHLWFGALGLLGLLLALRIRPAHADGASSGHDAKGGRA